MSEVNQLESCLADWSKKYQSVLSIPPNTGDILITVDGSDAVLIVEKQDGKPPFIYGKAYVPEIPDIEPQWYLQSTDQKNKHGWKVILMANARTNLIKKIGLDGETVAVKSLRIVKQSQSGKSLLAEVAEYCDE